MNRGLRCIEQAAECKEILDERYLAKTKTKTKTKTSRRKRKVVDGALVGCESGQWRRWTGDGQSVGEQDHAQLTADTALAAHIRQKLPPTPPLPCLCLCPPFHLLVRGLS